MDLNIDMGNIEKTKDELLQELQELKSENEFLKINYQNDISKYKQEEKYRHISVELLAILNETNTLSDAINRILNVINDEFKFDAIGIRLVNGEDYPYFAQSGFSTDFLLTENSLIARETNGEPCRDLNGKLNLECTCGLVISGNADLSLPFFTDGGSFWTNDSKPLLQLTAEEDPRFHPRNNCIHQHYWSVALVPIKTNQKIVGLLQLNDKKKDRFTLEMIQFFEGISKSIGVALMRKQAEEALLNSEARFRSYFNMPLHGIAITSPEKGWVEVNDAVCSILGFSREELFNMTWSELTYPEDLAEDEKQFERALIGEIEQYSLEKRFVRKDKTIVWTSLSVGCVRKSDRSVDYMVAMLEDITEKKKSSNRIVEVQMMLNRIINLLPVRVFWKDNDLKYLGCNKLFATDAGKSNSEELLGKDDYQMPWKEQADLYRNDDRAIIDSKSPKLNFEEPQTTPNGEKIWLKTSKVPLTDLEGNSIGILGTYEDITESKQKEEELRKLLMAVEQSTASIVITDIDGNIEYGNPRITEVTGYKLEEIFGKNPRIFSSSEKSKDEYKNLWDTISSGKEWKGEFHNKKKNGQLYWESATISPIKNSNDEITHFLAIKDDITLRKQTEDALLKSEERYRILSNQLEAILDHIPGKIGRAHV